MRIIEAMKQKNYWNPYSTNAPTATAPTSTPKRTEIGAPPPPRALPVSGSYPANLFFGA
jgi:hypothetical protein